MRVGGEKGNLAPERKEEEESVWAERWRVQKVRWWSKRKGEKMEATGAGVGSRRRTFSRSRWRRNWPNTTTKEWEWRRRRWKQDSPLNLARPHQYMSMYDLHDDRSVHYAQETSNFSSFSFHTFSSFRAPAAKIVDPPRSFLKMYCTTKLFPYEIP